MAFIVARTEKRKVGSLVGYQNHVDRKTENHENKDIDKSKTHLNYDLVGHEKTTSFKEEFMDFIEENKVSTRAIRKDAVVLQDWLISSSQEFFEGLDDYEIKKYFEIAVEFFAEKFGQENIRFATVHMDEKTPHMHMGIVPMKDGRLTSKTIFDRNCLRMIQEELPELYEAYGYDIERGKQGSQSDHIDFQEYKKTVEDLKENIRSLQDDIVRADNKIKEKEKEIKEKEEHSKEKFYDIWEKDWDRTKEYLPEFELDFNISSKIFGSSISEEIWGFPKIDKFFPREFSLSIDKVLILFQEKLFALIDYALKTAETLKESTMRLQKSESELKDREWKFNKERRNQNELLADTSIALGVHESWRKEMVELGGQIGEFKDGRKINKPFDQLIPEKLQEATRKQLEDAIEVQQSRRTRNFGDGGMTL